MVISKINEIQEEPISYPIIKRHIITHQIVLFIKPNTGISIDPGPSKYDFGYYSTDYYEDRFEIYNNPITLKNK